MALAAFFSAHLLSQFFVIIFMLIALKSPFPSSIFSPSLWGIFYLWVLQHNKFYIFKSKLNISIIFSLAQFINYNISYTVNLLYWGLIVIHPGCTRMAIRVVEILKHFNIVEVLVEILLKFPECLLLPCYLVPTYLWLFIDSPTLLNSGSGGKGSMTIEGYGQPWLE